MNDEILQPIAEFHASDLRRALKAYGIKMPVKATKQELYNRLKLAMRLSAAMMQR